MPLRRPGALRTGGSPALVSTLELWASGRLSGLALMVLRLAMRGYASGWIGRATFYGLVARAALLHTAAKQWRETRAGPAAVAAGAETRRGGLT